MPHFIVRKFSGETYISSAAMAKPDKSEKKKHKKEADVGAEADGAVKKKKDKKLKKAKALAEDVEAHVSAKEKKTSQEKDAGDSEMKKKKKKDKKSKEAGEDSAKKEKKRTTEEPDESGGSEKKKKKKKAAAAADDEAPGAMASVGNIELATMGRAVKKNLYKEHSEVADMSKSALDDIRKKEDMTVDGCSLAPIMEFKYLDVPADILSCTSTFQRPSAIQAQSWPIVLSGRDLVGIASTGSGKTLAFGLPAMVHIKAQLSGTGAGEKKGARPVMLCLAPTRELACQIQEVLEAAGKACGIRSICCYGGVPKQHQVKALRAGVEIVVATPGRLEDLVEDGACLLSQVSFFVLDEADRMLDLGFEPHIRSIAKGIRADRQTVMFSATWPQEVQRLAMDYMANPARVTIGSEDLTANHAIKQYVEVIDQRDRGRRLEQILRKHHTGTERVLVFVLYKKEAPRVEEFLQSRNFKALAIHGDMGQRDRTISVEEFKSGKTPILIATDVAARGLDIPDVEVVINYSFPLTIEDYIHRIGRTGRAGKTGISYTFFCGPQDKPRSGELINVLREAGQDVPGDLLKFGTTVKKKESKLYGAHFKDVDMNAKATKITFDDSDDDE